MTLIQERSQFSQAWRQLTRDRITFIGLLFLIALYGLLPFVGFLAPYRPDFSDRTLSYAPPTPIFVAREGVPTWPFVVKYTRRYDADTYAFGFYPDYGKEYPLKLLIKGQSYKLFGLIPCDRHLFGVDTPARIYLLGTDLNGWDNFSRLLYGAVFSLTVGFLGLLVSFPIGMFFGGLAGYFGGRTDNWIMRLAEIMMSFPTFYLLIGLAAFLPSNLTSTMRLMLIIVILAAIGWAGLARVIRGMVLSIREQEYVEAARSLGEGPIRIILRHVLPQTATFLVIAATLNVPAYLLAESALSFLGLGIQPPDASWGNMLREGQDLSNLILRPWLLLGPGLMIFLTILAFNVVGDKLRDILDPKSRGRPMTR